MVYEDWHGHKLDREMLMLLQQKRWEEKVAIRRRLQAAFARLDPGSDRKTLEKPR